MLPLYKPEDYKRVLETALLVASEPLPLVELKKLFDQEFDDDTWRTLLDDLRRDWANRGAWNWCSWPPAGASRPVRSTSPTSTG
jgi:hypothetical protein